MYTAKDVQTLRQRTGAGMMECKKALEETQGNMEKAIEHLRTKGIAKAEKRAGRAASEGVIGHYVHHNGKVGVLVEVNCETDFVARTDDFQQLGRDIAQHIIGMMPQYVRAEEVPADVRERERRIHDGSDEEVDRKLVLLAQPFVRDPKKTIGGMVQEAIGKLGENIVVRRFTRYELGEVVVGEGSDTGDDSAGA